MSLFSKVSLSHPFNAMSTTTLPSASNLTEGANERATSTKLKSFLRTKPGLRMYDSNTAGFSFACSRSFCSTWPCPTIVSHGDTSFPSSLCTSVGGVGGGGSSSTYPHLPIFTQEPERFGLVALYSLAAHVYEAELGISAVPGRSVLLLLRESPGRSQGIVKTDSSCFVVVRNIWLPESPDKEGEKKKGRCQRPYCFAAQKEEF